MGEISLIQFKSYATILDECDPGFRESWRQDQVYLHKLFKRFLSCEKGNIALMTAGVMVPLLSVGVGVADLTMRLEVRENMQLSADRAVLAAIGGTVQGRWREQRLAHVVFHANLIERNKIDRLQTRLVRGRKPGYRVLRYEVVAQMDGLLGGANPVSGATIRVSSTAAKDLRSAAPPKLISESTSQGAGSNNL